MVPVGKKWGTSLYTVLLGSGQQQHCYPQHYFQGIFESKSSFWEGREREYLHMGGFYELDLKVVHINSIRITLDKLSHGGHL